MLQHWGCSSCGVIGGLGDYLYQAKVNAVAPQQLPKQPLPQAKKFEME